LTEPLIIVSPARITVGRLETLRLNDTYANAPEPPPSPEFGGIRTSPANLLYLHTLFPTAVWHDPHNRLVEARAYRFIARLRQEEPGEYERSFPFKWQPKDYQLKLFTHARRMTNIALSPVALGTGKSKMTIDIAADKFLRDEIDILIVIAPNGVHRQWINTAIPTHLPECVKWVGAVWRPTRKTPKEVMEAPRGVRRLRVLTFNVESLSAEGGKAAKELRKLMATGRAMLVMDESSRIKNPRAQRTKAIVKLRALAAVRVILTGTPVTKGMEDFYTQYEFLDPAIIGMTNYYAFRNRYCVMMPAYRGAGVGAVKITGYKNQEELIRKIAPVSFMIGPEVLGLREPRYERFEVEPTAEQTQIYRMLKEMLIEDLRDKKIVTPANAAVRILRMQQVLCGRYYERVEVEGEEEVYAQEPRIIPSNRPDALLSLLEQHDGQAVIWARFKEDIDDIVAAAGTVGRVTIYDGRTDDRDREIAVESFKRGEIDYFVANPAAGGTGVDGLQVCQNAFYYSNSYNAEHRWQSEGRTYRLGQQGSPLYVDLVVPNSVDTMILDNLKAKRDLGKAIMDNPAMLNGGL